MNKTQKKRTFLPEPRTFPAHLQLILSAVLITEWILTLFNPNLGLVNMNDRLSKYVLLLAILVTLTNGVMQTAFCIAEHRRPILRADAVGALLLAVSWAVTSFSSSVVLIDMSDTLCCIELIVIFCVSFLSALFDVIH